MIYIQSINLIYVVSTYKNVILILLSHIFFPHFYIWKYVFLLPLFIDFNNIIKLHLEI